MASIVQTKSTAINKTPQHQHHHQHQSFSASKTTVSKTASVNSNSKTKPEKAASNSQLHKRSASFHYPDGSSRVTHSVYSSEEDFNDDEEDEEPRLYEVNDDELFLAY